MNHDDVHPIPWRGEGSVPPAGGVPPRHTRARGRLGVVAGSLALVIGMGVGGVAVSRLSLGAEQTGSGSGTSQPQGDDEASGTQGSGAVQPPAAGGEERDED